MTLQLDAPAPAPGGEPRPPATTGNSAARLIDVWFPCREVDQAVGTARGSGRSEKALFTWFASRPIAQARAAVLCSLLPDTAQNRADIRAVVLGGDPLAFGRLRDRIAVQYEPKPPVVLDVFSGRGIIPLEAARAGATAVGTDLSPVATLGGRLLADFPMGDWSTEPTLPYVPPDTSNESEENAPAPVRRRPRRSASAQGTFEHMGSEKAEPRLLADVRVVLAEIGRRVAAKVADLYPGNPERNGETPWAYLWAVTIPCDSCSRRFPLVGSMVLRHPYRRTSDEGQSLRLRFDRDSFFPEVQSGPPDQEPVFTAAVGRRGKSARCPFPRCGRVHSLDVVKAKGFAGQYQDALLAVAETDHETNQKIFRIPRPDETAAARSAAPSSLPDILGLAAVPDELIPAGNKDNVRASGYGYQSYGSLFNPRQSVLLATTVQTIIEIHDELAGLVSQDYAGALTTYAASNVMRQIKTSTRGAGSRPHGNPSGTEQNRVQVDHIFSSQSVVKHQFDYLEVGSGAGPGTWASVSTSLANALRKVLEDNQVGGRPARFRRESATTLPFRDGTVDALVTDPPYYDMIAYADSSDLFHAWFKRALRATVPDLFDSSFDGADGLQDKTDEIIVKGRGAKGAGDHRSDEARYERLLAQSFDEARRVLKADGHLTVIYGHADPEAWKRLLSALATAGFVVTSSWPSRTETAVTGVATISVTVSIGARVAPPHRPIGLAAQVDAEVVTQVKQLCRGWDRDGLALDDQLMASYGAALQIVGRHSKVLTPDGKETTLDHYMSLSRRAVRDAVALRLDEQPLETFDPHTRLAIFWHVVHGRQNVPRGEARFFAQSDGLRLEDLRGPILAETRAGYRLRHDAPGPIGPASSAYEVVRGMAAAWPSGTDAVAACLAASQRPVTDAHVWALVDWLTTKLPPSDPVAVALAAIKRNHGSVQAVAAQTVPPEPASQSSLFEEKP
ncbi:putative DNA methylase [Frankia sp. Hr75.2]|nr:putative DNA methylase [Frankia sp. Hr75.2]